MSKSTGTKDSFYGPQPTDARRGESGEPDSAHLQRANSSKKMKKVADLHRATSSPSHHDSMTQMFHHHGQQITEETAPPSLAPSRAPQAPLMRGSEYPAGNYPDMGWPHPRHPYWSHHYPGYGNTHHQNWNHPYPVAAPTAGQAGFYGQPNLHPTYAYDSDQPYPHGWGTETGQGSSPYQPPSPRKENVRPHRGNEPMPATPNKEPTSSGPKKQNEPVRRDFTNDLLGLSLGYTSGPDDDETHSTHGVPLIFKLTEPERRRQQSQESVTSWLENVSYPNLPPDTPSERAGPRQGRGRDFGTGASSHRENFAPPKERRPAIDLGVRKSAQSSPISPQSMSEFPPLAAPPTGPPRPENTPPGITLPYRPAGRNDLGPAPGSQPAQVKGTPALNSGHQHPLNAPRGPAALSRHPKGPPFPMTADRLTGAQFKASAQAKKDAAAAAAAAAEADEADDELAELSPSVARYRRGKGPKMERSASYWDEDILPEDLKREERK